MNAMDFYFYNLGEEPSEYGRKTAKKVFDFLYDNGYEDNEIIKIMKYFPKDKLLTHEDLPDILWEGSLLKKDKFYYHNSLHIESEPPYWDIENNIIISTNYYREMKIMLTVNDIIDYYYSKFEKGYFDNINKDKGTVEYLLKRYSNIDFVSNVDFILFLIDEAYNRDREIKEIIDIQRFEKETTEYLKNKVAASRVGGDNVIRWR